MGTSGTWIVDCGFSHIATNDHPVPAGGARVAQLYGWSNGRDGERPVIIKAQYLNPPFFTDTEFVSSANKNAGEVPGFFMEPGY